MNLLLEETSPFAAALLLLTAGTIALIILLAIAVYCTVLPTIISLLTGCLMRGHAHRFGLEDRPGGHKAHQGTVPLGGGVGIFLGLALPLLIATLAAWTRLAPTSVSGVSTICRELVSRAPQTLGILAAAGGLCLLGIRDDRKPLGPWLKLWVQIACAAAVVLLCGVRVLTLAGEIPSIVITILWIVGLTNSFNFLDNMDGLAGGVGLLCAITLALVAMITGQWIVVMMAILLAGALAGFLPHNLAPARLYMGDAGSLVVGFWLACCSCMVTYAPASGLLGVGWLIPLCIMAVPIYDTFSVFYLRWRRGESIMVGDRRHFSHRLLLRGLSVRQAVATICLATAVSCSGAVILACASSLLVAGIVGLQIAAVLILIGMLEAIWKVDID
ncbi:MAG: undecaprenyl/decaprenyl-phosphate alpha-N-acetylglucosaminyl 1-phosphate transferase [Phycisphaerales bacterium]|jgi:UDP-GlcNAc:undecaprenyl-phosphate/decaprenyl-phosphate GlcNAc-1-phosphate transferase|nr:undecaprenyl/decaprenyl-phosphate alpha-N-acetylglucosaminyl 1-phosphate transferase [Phycisphaerales bacterium]MBT7170486.1 undecaprenyl/decaprenyl-phosphate alpha-N-acetylglucosaminyl 1-phosphate transferase [Phycisphaerales bacterium]